MFNNLKNVIINLWVSPNLHTGPCWQHLVGSTYIYGNVDRYGEFTGDDIAFVYQDLQLALIGEFKKGIMVIISFYTQGFFDIKTFQIYAAIGYSN